MLDWFRDRDKTYFYQLACSIVLGVLFSAFTDCLVVVLLFSVLLELVTFIAAPGWYNPILRIPTVCAYVFGWILGRAVFEQAFCIMRWDCW